VHLKRLTLATLVWDYFKKSQNAIDVRRRYASLFRNATLRLPRGLALSWLAQALMPIAALGLTSQLLMQPAAVLLGLFF
jgi:hypothetical protein